MRIFRHFDTLPDDARGAAVAIGNFDGVHPGHRAVINEAGLIARDEGVPWAVLTFEPHPRQLFTPNQPPFRLTPLRAKAQQIEAMGADLLIVQRFNKAFSEIEAEDFIRDALVRGQGKRKGSVLPPSVRFPTTPARFIRRPVFATGLKTPTP